MALVDLEVGGHVRKDGAAVESDDAAEDPIGITFTFDTTNGNPVDHFHVMSLFTDRFLQYLAADVSRLHPDLETVGDYKELTKAEIENVLIDMDVVPEKRERFVSELSHVIDFS